MKTLFKQLIKYLDFCVNILLLFLTLIIVIAHSYLGSSKY